MAKKMARHMITLVIIIIQEDKGPGVPHSAVAVLIVSAMWKTIRGELGKISRWFSSLAVQMVTCGVSRGFLLCRLEDARDLSPTEVKVLINRSCKAFLSSSRVVIPIQPWFCVQHRLASPSTISFPQANHVNSDHSYSLCILTFHI